MKPQELADQAAKSLYGQTAAEAKATKTCIRCKKEATKFKDQASTREYEQTAFCQTCQDEIFGE
jgi:hypothetical protein